MQVAQVNPDTLWPQCPACRVTTLRRLESSPSSPVGDITLLPCRPAGLVGSRLGLPWGQAFPTPSRTNIYLLAFRSSPVPAWHLPPFFPKPPITLHP